MPAGVFSLFAVHISDGVLGPAWLAGGFAITVCLLVAALWRVRDQEIPQIALLTAAFFVVSSIHLKIGPTSCHLLLNGLVGIVLGRRAILAIVLALALQCVLLAHGGLTALGVNCCVLGLPALVAWGAFHALRTAPWLRRPWFRGLLVAASVLVWSLSLVWCVALLANYGGAVLGDLAPARANTRMAAISAALTGATDVTFHPMVLVGAAFIVGVMVWVERRLRAAPEFALGLVIGEATVLATIALHGAVLTLGSVADLTLPALVSVVVHLPLAVLEGVVLGFVVGFLARVKPELLGWSRPLEVERNTSHAPSQNGLAPERGVLPGAADGQPSAGAPPVCQVQGAAEQPGADRELLRRG
jgi:cobalt/nickel transport system permease protein